MKIALCKAVISLQGKDCADFNQSESDSVHASPVILQTYDSSSTVSKCPENNSHSARWAIFTLHRVPFAPARKLYRIGALFAHKNGDFDAISVTKRSDTAPISKKELYILDRFCATIWPRRSVNSIRTAAEVNKWEQGLESTQTA